MALRKCCVGSCDSTSASHRLFKIPKDDNLRQLWLSFLIPTNVELSGLTKHQLVERRVCQNHFDRYQFDSVGNRLQHGYPCLMTAKEIAYGIPLSSSFGDHLIDHNYCSHNVAEDSIEASTSRVVEGDHSYDKSQVSIDMEPLSESEIGPKSTGDYSYGKSQLPIEVEPFSEPEIGAKLTHIQKAHIAHTSRVTKQECLGKLILRPLDKLGANKTSTNFIRKIKKQAVAIDKSQKPFIDRLADARSLSQDYLFKKNFAHLNKPSQNFLMMQLKLAEKKKKAQRYTNDEKLLSLALMKESPKGYRLLQKMFKLPSKRTLNRLAEDIHFNVGVNENLFRLIQKKCEKWDDMKKLCTLIFDEVALTPHLTFVESKDEIKGFMDLGDKKKQRLADHALVFMLRGVCSNWKQPIAYYFCEGTTSAEDVKKILKGMVAKVATSCLIPVALICDQGSTFRSAIKMIKEETTRKRNLNNEHDDGTIEVSGQCLSVVYDPPHLLKGIRNNFLTKDMIFKGKHAKWSDILSVYRTDCEIGHTRMNKTLTEKHVVAEKIKKMKVSVAAQVLSEKTSAMLKYTSRFKTTIDGEPVSKTMATTGEAVEFMDQLFDSVNGSKNTTVKGKLRGPIKPTSEHFKFWREAVVVLENIKFVDSTSKNAIRNKKDYYVRVPSLDGWITTLKSVERIAKLLFEKYNVKYLYPRNINQDPLENFFGRIRAINYRNVNPDCYTFINSFKSLLISNVMGPHSIYSNCEDDNGQTIIDFFNILQNSCSENKENIPIQMNAVQINKLKSTSKISEPTNSITENKENIPIQMNVVQIDKFTSTSRTSEPTNPISEAIKERVRVHSSAYTAGYLARKLTCRFNCTNCKKSYLSNEKENVHLWIAHREYKRLKHSNLAYPSKDFLMLYSNITNLIHSFLNKNGEIKNITKCLREQILLSFKLDWLGCTVHKSQVLNMYLKLILRVHLHNWCNIINKILRGEVDEKYVKKMGEIHVKAYAKYKAHRLKNKK